MDMTFHFLRPAWLLAIPVVAVVIWHMARRQDPSRPWQGMIDDHLLPHLLVRGAQTARVQPWHVLSLIWIIAALALAGPTWQREPSPFTEDTASLFIILKASSSMETTDIQPSRMDRAVHKIRDLMIYRAGAKTGLIAYSGSAHLVMPLTSDTNIISSFAAEISPDIMPKDGDAAGDAVAMAMTRLKAAGLPGSVLLVADGITPEQKDRLGELHRNLGYPVQILSMDANPNPTELKAAATAGGGLCVAVTSDGRDLERLNARVERSWQSTLQEKGGERWRDAGYWLLPWIALAGLMWFRSGWVVQDS